MLETPGFKTWCETCHWNLQRPNAPTAKNGFEQTYQGLSQQQSDALLNTLQAQKLYQNGAIQPSRLARALAACISASYALLWLISAFLIYIGQTYTLSLCFGLLGIAIACVLWPLKYQSTPDEYQPLDKFPALQAWLSQMAKDLETPAPQYLHLTPDYAIHLTTQASKQTPVLCLGLPLWSMLEGPEKVFVLAYEMKHFAAQDPWFASWFQFTLTLIFKTGKLFYPRPPIPHSSLGGFGLTLGLRSFLGPLDIRPLIRGGFRAIAWIIWRVGHYFVQLIWQESQITRYLADLAALQYTSLDIAKQSIKKTSLDIFFEGHAHKWLVQRQKPEDLFENALLKWKQLPAKERDRYEALMGYKTHATEVLQPPTTHRIKQLQFQNTHRPVSPLVHSSSVKEPDWNEIDQELKPHALDLAQQVIEHQRSILFNATQHHV